MIPSPPDSAEPATAAVSTEGVRLERIAKRFSDVVALGGVDLNIPRGTFFSLLGPSGCGKTTLLRIIAGLESPDEGAVLFDGRDITRRAADRRPFNMVFQRYALFPHLSVQDNVAFGLTTQRSQRPPAKELARRVHEMLELVGLAGLERRYPAELSGGQAQRVALARALIKQPAVLLLDEPLSALDRNVRHAMREELLRIHSELGTTFLLVTHDQDEALSMSQMVALMNRGQVEQVADPEVMYRMPATPFAARFIGAGTLVPAVADGRDGDRVVLRIEGRPIAAIDAGAPQDGEARVLLRPEDLLITDRDGLDCVVETSSFFGSHYEIRARGGVGLLRFRSSEAKVAGDQIKLTWSHTAGIAYPAIDD